MSEAVDNKRIGEITEHLALVIAVQTADDYWYLMSKAGAPVVVPLNPITYTKIDVLTGLPLNRNAGNVRNSLIRNYTDCVEFLKTRKKWTNGQG